MVNVAVAAVAVIAVVGAFSSYLEKYLTTSVSQWVGHDLRRTLYQHIQRLSLAEHDKSRSGDLITRVTSDIEAVQDFINSALLGMLVNVLTLLGMIGVMFYLDWRFTLIALSVAPVLFVVVYYFTRRIKKASRAVQEEGRRAAVHRRGGADVDPRRAGVHARGLRAAAVRLGEPGERRGRPAGAQRSRRRCRRSSRSSWRSAPASCSATARGWPSAES